MSPGINQRLEKFFSQGRIFKFRRGAIILAPQNPVHNIYFLKQGLVKQHLISSNKEQITLHLFKPGACFPLMLALKGGHNKYYFTAKTSVKLFSLPTPKVIKFLKTDPEILFSLTQRFARGLIGLLQRLENLFFSRPQDQVISLLLHLAKKFEVKHKDSHLVVPVTHAELASWLGLRRETINRQLATLKQQGVIIQRGRKIIIPSLKKLAGQRTSVPA